MPENPIFKVPIYHSDLQSLKKKEIIILFCKIQITKWLVLFSRGFGGGLRFRGVRKRVWMHPVLQLVLEVANTITFDTMRWRLLLRAMILMFVSQTEP